MSLKRSRFDFDSIASINYNVDKDQIAAITRFHNATLATRNVDDFHECGIEIINPWE
jgi:predicted nucleic acid-binding protein